MIECCLSGGIDDTVIPSLGEALSDLIKERDHILMNAVVQPIDAHR